MENGNELGLVLVYRQAYDLTVDMMKCERSGTATPGLDPARPMAKLRSLAWAKIGDRPEASLAIEEGVADAIGGRPRL
jgi:hypothetical protein